MVERGEFREDLWYRISVFPIRLPALRERVGDIPELARHFAARAGVRLGGTPLVPTPTDLQLLLGYDWPGNVRELASVIERAAILGGSKRLDVRAALHGPSGVFAAASPPPLMQPLLQPMRVPVRELPSAASTAFPTLDEAMVQHISRALERTGGCIEGPDGAAELLGINPHTLRSRMRKFNLDWRRFRDSR
jgi:hydrogenase-4 transcriptional activator